MVAYSSNPRKFPAPSVLRETNRDSRLVHGTKRTGFNWLMTAMLSYLISLIKKLCNRISNESTVRPARDEKCAMSHNSPARHSPNHDPLLLVGAHTDPGCCRRLVRRNCGCGRRVAQGGPQLVGVQLLPVKHLHSRAQIWHRMEE